ncbi:hypothetical protein ZEAMMB73_Zm00001d043484 [Zea mays]|uniref:Uncharacterized protein n=1 Tax=Zea mays TaxID=4577 RepID=A0A1D6NCK6_MAIZE|nr:hypothetical protein ZEAMMB73_Zm00001d043484 [Zea mays]
MLVMLVLHYLVRILRHATFLNYVPMMWIRFLQQSYFYPGVILSILMTVNLVLLLTSHGS